MPKDNNVKVTFSARLWWVITWIIMLVILSMVGKNFIGSIVFGTSTEKEEITSYYNAGFADSVSGKKNGRAELQLENPLLIKSYNKGFREGLDEKWQKEKK